MSKVLGIPSDIDLNEVSPRAESRIVPIEMLDSLNALTHRQFLKHHLVRKYLPPHARRQTAQIYVARDARDVVFSFYNFHSSFGPDMMLAFNTDRPDGA